MAVNQEAEATRNPKWITTHLQHKKQLNVDVFRYIFATLKHNLYSSTLKTCRFILKF